MSKFESTNYSDVCVVSIESDQDLIEQVLKGNQRAYEFLVARYQETIAKFIWRLIPPTLICSCPDYNPAGITYLVLSTVPIPLLVLCHPL